MTAPLSDTQLAQLAVTARLVADQLSDARVELVTDQPHDTAGEATARWLLQAPALVAALANRLRAVEAENTRLRQVVGRFSTEAALDIPTATLLGGAAA